MLTISPKMKVYQACVLSTLLYSNETWTLYSCQERWFNTFHLRCLRRNLGITWQDRVPNKDVLAQVVLPSMFSLLIQRWLRWLRHVSRMKDGRIAKDILYSELTIGTRPTGRPNLRFKVVCKRDLSTFGAIAVDRNHWRLLAKAGVWWEAKRAVEREKRGRTAEGSISTHRTKHGVHLQQRQQSLPIKNRTVQHSRRCSSTTD